MGLYDCPHRYDIAFSPGTSAQVAQLCTLFAEHQQTDVTSVLEVACGSGRIMMGLAALGYRVSGYDSNPLMVAFTAGRITQSGLGDRVDVRQADMRTATYPRRYDAAVNLFNSLGHLHDDGDIAAHLRGIANGLHPGGLYLVQVECAWNDLTRAEEGHWTAARDGVSTEVRWRILREDAGAKMSEQWCWLKVTDQWGEYVSEERVVLRLWLADDLSRLAAGSSLVVEAIYTEDLRRMPVGSSLSGELGNLYFVLRRC